MATKAEKDRRRRLLPLFILLAVAALCLLSMAAGWITSPLWDSMFGGGGGAGGGQADGGGGGGGDGGGCFLNIVCFNAAGSDAGAGGDADVTPPDSPLE
jgi:hypothetical protein